MVDAVVVFIVFGFFFFMVFRYHAPHLIDLVRQSRLCDAQKLLIYFTPLLLLSFFFA